jgi:hypothetical protein
VEPEEAAIARQWPSKYAPVEMDTYTTMEELQEAAFSMW